MKIFVGLGNPGDDYSNTKHNVGFMLADKLAEELNVDSWKENFNALIADTFLNGEKIFIVKPLTFMNASGESVRPIMDYFKLSVDDLVVAHDDMDLPLGSIRLRPKGSGGGHHGIESVIQHLGGQQNFSRIRIGIGHPPKFQSVNQYVLSNFNVDDFIKIKSAIDSLVPATICIFNEGINHAMNKFNPSKKKSVVNEVHNEENNCFVC